MNEEREMKKGKYLMESEVEILLNGMCRMEMELPGYMGRRSRRDVFRLNLFVPGFLGFNMKLIPSLFLMCIHDVQKCCTLRQS